MRVFHVKQAGCEPDSAMGRRGPAQAPDAKLPRENAIKQALCESCFIQDSKAAVRGLVCRPTSVPPQTFLGDLISAILI